MHYDYLKKGDREAHYRSIRHVLWITLALNFAVALAKFAYGVAFGSLAMKADGIHSFFDATSNIVGLIALIVASQPADREHQYGHQKYEVLASIAISLLLFSGAYSIISEAWTRLGQGAVPNVGWGGVLVMVVTMGINFGVSSYEKREGTRLNSPVLLADSQHTASDIYASFAVIASIFFAWLGWGWMDIIIAGFIGLVIIRAGYRIIAEGLLMISDAAVLDPIEVRRLVIEGIPEVREAHRVRTRGVSGHILMDLHVEVDPDLTVAAAHRIVLKIEKKLAENYPGMSDITVHLDPYPSEKYELEEMKELRLSEESIPGHL